jgi:hypothetical protein
MDVLPVMNGPQGGYHLWTAFSCTDCNINQPIVYGIKDPMTHDWLKGLTPLSAVAQLGKPTGWRQMAGLQNFLPGAPWDPMSKLPKGTHVVLYVAATDSQGAPLANHEAEVEVVLGDDEYWSPPCDNNPATCGQPGGLPCCSDMNFGG